LLAASVSYGWPALSTFGFSGNPALLLLVLNCRDCCLMFIYVKQLSSSSSSFSFTQYNLIHPHLQLRTVQFVTFEIFFITYHLLLVIYFVLHSKHL